MTIFLEIIIFLSAIVITLSVHELGHFFIAKFYKINISEYSIGFGPTIFYFYFKGVKFSFRFFLIGAFVLLDSKELRNYGKECLLEYQNLKIDLNKAKLKRWEHFFWLHKKGNYNYQNIKEFLQINGYIKYSRLLEKTPENKIIFNDCGNLGKNFITLAGILVNFFIFWIIFGILQIHKLNVNFDFYQLKLFLEKIFSPIVFINSENIVLYHSPNKFINFLILIMIFNLFTAILNSIPFPPLDMFKILTINYEFISKKSLNQKTIERIGIIGIIFILYLTLSPLITLMISTY
ncbi:MAG: site-2 protease family protein [Mycoplasmoidaceae bacterium]